MVLVIPPPVTVMVAVRAVLAVFLATPNETDLVPEPFVLPRVTHGSSVFIVHAVFEVIVNPRLLFIAHDLMDVVDTKRLAAVSV